MEIGNETPIDNDVWELFGKIHHETMKDSSTCIFFKSISNYVMIVLAVC